VRAEIEGSEGDWWVWVGGWVRRLGDEAGRTESTPRLMDGSIEELGLDACVTQWYVITSYPATKIFSTFHHVSLFSKIMQENPGKPFRGSEAVFRNVADFHFPCLDVANTQLSTEFDHGEGWR